MDGEGLACVYLVGLVGSPTLWVTPHAMYFVGCWIGLLEFKGAGHIHVESL